MGRSVTCPKCGAMAWMWWETDKRVGIHCSACGRATNMTPPEYDDACAELAEKAKCKVLFWQRGESDE